MGVFTCIEKTKVLGMVLACITCGAFCAKWAVFVWGAMIRVSFEGRVAAGRKIFECMQMNLGSVSSVRLLQDWTEAADAGVAPTEEEMPPTDEVSGPVCIDYEAFQIKGGKLIIAWLIVSGIKCL